MANTWPGSLPTLPLTQGNKESAPNLSIRTQVDVGPVKMRKRSTAGAWSFSASMILTNTQLGTFITFWQTTLSGGSDTFEWTHPRLGTTQNMRFSAPPEWTLIGYSAVPTIGKRWNVSMQLEMLP